MKRHAYLILAHTNFGQLRKLLELLDDPRNDIFVHVDGKADFDETQWKDACRSSRLTFTDRRLKVHWGGVSIMRAELLLLKTATQAGPYDYYHLLSGMDLPIKDQDTIHAFFDAHGGTEFLNFWNFKKTTRSRFSYYTLFPEGAGYFLTNLANNIFKGLQMAVGYRINRDVDFRFASQWFRTRDLVCTLCPVARRLAREGIQAYQHLRRDLSRDPRMELGIPRQALCQGSHRRA